MKVGSDEVRDEVVGRMTSDRDISVLCCFSWEGGGRGFSSALLPSGGEGMMMCFSINSSRVGREVNCELNTFNLDRFKEFPPGQLKS